MAKPSAEAPRRWSAKPEAETDAALSELFRAVADPRPLSPVDLAPVRVLVELRLPMQTLT